MAYNNKFLIKDIPKNKFHSAIFTSYSFQFYFFEFNFLPSLAEKGINYVAVFTDAGMLNQQLGDMTYFCQHKMRNYGLYSIQSKGAFHPKINFFVGNKDILVQIGSGNLTSGGYGQNHELWSSIYINDKSDEKWNFVQEVWAYLVHYAQQNGKTAIKQINEMRKNCELLSDIDLPNHSISYVLNNNKIADEIVFLNNHREVSIYQQLNELLAQDSISEAWIIAPFFDINGSFIQSLGKYPINIILPKEGGAPPINIPLTTNIRFYEWNESINKLTDNQTTKFPHVKYFYFKGSKHYCLVGSMNPSKAAFGNRVAKGVNEEVGILMISNERDFLKELSIKKNELIPIKYSELKNMKRRQDSSIKEESPLAYETQILYAEKMGNLLEISLEHEISGINYKCLFFNEKGEVIGEGKELDKYLPSKKIILESDKKALYLVLYHNNIAISTKCLIQNQTLIEINNPSPNNRSFNYWLQMIEQGESSSFDFVDYLSEAFSNIANQSPIHQQINTTQSHQNNKTTNINTNTSSDKTYEELKLIKEEAEKNSFSNQFHLNGIKLWEGIFETLSIQMKKDTILNEENEEDEKEKEENTTNQQIPNRQINRNQFEQFRFKLFKYLENYTTFLSNRNPPYYFDVPAIANYLINVSCE